MPIGSMRPGISTSVAVSLCDASSWLSATPCAHSFHPSLSVVPPCLSAAPCAQTSHSSSASLSFRNPLLALASSFCSSSSLRISLRHFCRQLMRAPFGLMLAVPSWSLPLLSVKGGAPPSSESLLASLLPASVVLLCFVTEFKSEIEPENGNNVTEIGPKNGKILRKSGLSLRKVGPKFTEN